MNEYNIYIDGGSKGNPGPSGSGFIIYDKDGSTPLMQKSRYIGEKTNNQAEYDGFIFAAESILHLFENNDLNKLKFNIHTDSELLYNQLIGKYKVKSKNLISLLIKASELKALITNLELRLIPRNKNRIADTMVNNAIMAKREISL